MALPQDGQDANGLTKVTQIPAGKELMFIDPTTNEGGIITLEDLTKQILNGLASQAFALDAGQMTLLAALNKLNSDSPKGILNHIASKTNVGVISVDVSKIDTEGNSIPFMLCFCDWTTGRTEISIGCYRGNEKKQQPKVIVGETTINSVTCDGTTLEVQFRQFSYIALYY